MCMPVLLLLLLVPKEPETAKNPGFHFPNFAFTVKGRAFGTHFGWNNWLGKNYGNFVDDVFQANTMRDYFDRRSALVKDVIESIIKSVDHVKVTHVKVTHV